MRRIAALLALFLCAGVAAVVVASASSPPPPSTPAAWTGVLEIVRADLGMDGAMSGTPSQNTTVTGMGTGSAKVDVPVSSKPQNRGPGKRLHHPPTVANGAVTFDFATNGTASQYVKSNFAKPLPVKVTPTYQLNGNQASPSQLSASKTITGDVLVTYKIANVTSATKTVHFTSPGGASKRQKVTEPVPYLAEVKITFKKDSTGLDAPGATLTPLPKSVQAVWYLLLAPPLGSATQSVSYSLRLNGGKIPQAKIELKAIAVSPKSSSKSKSSKSGSSKSGHLSKSGRSSKSGHTKAGSSSSGHSGTGRSQTTSSKSGRSKGAGAVSGPALFPLGPISPRAPRGGTSPQAAVAITAAEANAQARLAQAQVAARSALAKAHRNITVLDSAQNTAMRNTAIASDARTGNVTGASQAALNDLSTRVASDQSRAGTAITAALGRVIVALDTVGRHATELVAVAHPHAAKADALAHATAALKHQTGDLVATATQHANDVTALVQMITQSIADLNAFPDHTTPEWLKLSDDLTAAQAKAQAALNEANSFAGPASSIDSAVGHMQSDAAALASDADAAEAKASGVQTDLQTQVANTVDQLQGQLGIVKSQARGLGKQIDAAEAHIGDVAGNAHTAFEAKQAQITSTLASTAQSAKAAAQAATASAEQELATIQTKYVQLLAAQQIGLENQLPGGNATGAVTQTGYYIISVAGT